MDNKTTRSVSLLSWQLAAAQQRLWAQGPLVLSFRSTGRGLQAWQHPRELSPGVTQQLTEEERKSLAMGFRVAGHGHTSDLLSDSLCPCAAFGEVALL